MITNSVKILEQLQHPSGLFSASSLQVNTGYDKAWIRDCIYESLGFEAVKDWKRVKKTYHALLDLLLKHEYKIEHAIKEKPTEKWQYIHARFHPETFEEFHEDWGNRQNDAVGAFLFKVGDLELKGIKIIRNEHDKRILQKLVHYLGSIEYWKDEDNGVWEENEEVHASSVGACVAGLKMMQKIVDVDPELIEKGQETLNWLLPNESITKRTDLALLSLIYPFKVVNDEQRDAILERLEHELVRDYGVIRYHNDVYYGKNGREAEWTMGLAWLGIIYKNLNNPAKYAHYMRKTIGAMNELGELPELYFGGTDEHNENSPLGWSQALFLVMMEE